MSEDQSRYEFEDDEEFMKFLRDLYPQTPDAWECEYSGNLRNLYAAYRAGQDPSSREYN